MKFIALILGLIVGFAGGIWIGVRNPELASSLDKKREQWILEGKKQATEAITKKMDDILNKSSASTSTPGAGFLGSGGSSASTTDALRQLRDEQQQQLRSLQDEISKKK